MALVTFPENTQILHMSFFLSLENERKIMSIIQESISFFAPKCYVKERQTGGERKITNLEALVGLLDALRLDVVISRELIQRLSACRKCMV